MERNEIIERIDALRREAGITHDELAAIVYEARDKHLRKIRNEHQEKFIIFSFPDCISYTSIVFKAATLSCFNPLQPLNILFASVILEESIMPVPKSIDSRAANPLNMEAQDLSR